VETSLTGNIWKTELDRTLATEVAVDSGGVIVGGGAGTVLSIDPETGTKNWGNQVDELLLSTPAITSERAFVASGSVYAFGREEGELLWEQSANGVANAPNVHDGIVYTTETVTGRVRGLQVDSGAEVWKKSIPPSEYPPAVDDTGVYAATNKGVLCFDHEGTKRWERHNSSHRSPVTPPVLTDSHLYYCSRHGDVVCLDTDTGAVLWRKTLKQGASLSAPAISPNGVVVHVDGRNLALLEGQTGKVIDTVTTSDERSSNSELLLYHPVVCDDRAVLHGGDRDVHLVEIAENGMDHLGTIDLQQDVTVTPLVLDGVLYASGKHISAIAL